MNNKINSFIDLAERFLPKNQVEKFKTEQERQYRSDTYFAHKKMYDEHIRKVKAKEIAQKRAELKAILDN